MNKDTSLGTLFRVFLRLGLTSFGGPVAHLGYFRDEFVVRRKWLDDHAYADLVALCQVLPGPASSQVNFGIGMLRAGWLGGLIAWCGFTLPSAILMVAFALGLDALGGASAAGWVHGLKLAAVAVVAQAVWGMGKSLTPDAPRLTVAALAAGVMLVVGGAWMQVAVIAAGGLAGLALPKTKGLPTAGTSSLHPRIGRGTALAALALFALLMIGLPVAAATFPSHTLAVFDAFYRAGALVFGGGHVVLPLLQAEVVPPGWVAEDTFLAGYGAAQAMPGPLFTFAAYLGFLIDGWLGVVVALAAIYIPSILLVVGALPSWDGLRHHPKMRASLAGINAAVVGLLLAAFYDPVLTGAVRGGPDAALALLSFVLLTAWKVPVWAVVGLAAAAGWGMATL